MHAAPIHHGLAVEELQVGRDEDAILLEAPGRAFVEDDGEASHLVSARVGMVLRVPLVAQREETATLARSADDDVAVLQVLASRERADDVLLSANEGYLDPRELRLWRREGETNCQGR